MRQMWELPGPTLLQRAGKAAVAIALVWALAAVPLTVWLATRERPLPPAPPTRPLSAMEAAAVRASAQSLATDPVKVESTVTTANAQLQVSQVVDVSRAVSYGDVTSQSHHGDLIVVSGHTLLRGSPQFWASVGIPTSEPGWIDVDDRLGVIPFPMLEAVSQLDPTDETYVDHAEAGAETVTFHSGDLAAVFTEAGIAEMTVGDREGKLSPAPGDATSSLNAAANTTVPTTKLIGASGALTVSVAPPAPPAPESGN
ncbi:hypothetical protein H7J07_05560 [Mycobacterium koreense]|nr:hypothetical protein [Mycolicibacillus koreensis]MCV7247691.1 hypothetical protein [Mycolicibacillus koreensis]BBY54076.1 hypothetical protein MKOR_13270 [Mycolicibacillus koreensis]